MEALGDQTPQFLFQRLFLFGLLVPDEAPGQGVLHEVDVRPDVGLHPAGPVHVGLVDVGDGAQLLDGGLDLVAELLLLGGDLGFAQRP